ncbi:anthranilate phosphoribosyltransferase [Oceanobacillus oncorhynchi subsp. incaldanensis]|uniref:Anthranilate phosphoribosyltransferase n=1 Tax=Oceanobacillus aidingensis TaxID=645964 RepID=A0ABV9JWF0_9BACI|nr:anthranilate phosphoribosyltransferase [Oceanobacillus oncorhynchi]GIO18820.1 anthranilate phosphoribosyltransferase [Oceanobacillus oncorhynchi subsp. incaldanensis]
MKPHFNQLLEGTDLSFEETKALFNACFQEEVSDTELSAILVALKMKQPTAEELAGLAEVIHTNSPFQFELELPAMDNCGTGGDRSNSFNISTCAAFVLAGAGVTVAKHGNRRISSQTGSADVLEELGVSLDLTKSQMKYMLQENQIAFLFAQHVHPTLKQIAGVRQKLRTPTIFNLVGPLTNPVALHSQLVGVYSNDALPIVAKSLQTLGRKRALVIHGAGGMDEASLQGENNYILLENNELKAGSIHPEEVGLSVYTNQEIEGGDAKRNAEILLSVLNGEPGAYLDTVLFNTAIALFAIGRVDSVKDGMEIASHSVFSGNAKAKLDTLVDYSQEAKQEVV